MISHLRLHYEYPEVESRLSEWAVIHLERIKDDLKHIGDQKGEDSEYREKLSLLTRLF